MFTNKKKTRVKILKFESKNYASRFEKKKTRVEKETTLTSCDINRCLHFTETKFRSKLVVCWLPNIAEFFSSFARLIEDLERQLSSASYDNSEFLFRRLDEYKRTREVKSQLAEIQITKPKHNLSRKDPQALKELQQNTGARRYSSKCRNKNSELSCEAELSCLSKSSISLAREKKKSAIFGSQQTTTLDRSLVSVKWRHWLITQLVSVLSFSTQVFFFWTRLAYFFRLKFQNFDSCLKSWHLLSIFFFRSWTYIFCKPRLIFFIAFGVFYKFWLTYYVFNMFLPSPYLWELNSIFM